MALSADADRLVADARDRHWEDPAGCRELAVQCHAQGRASGDVRLQARALVVLGCVSVNGGDLRGAFARAAEAHLVAVGCDDLTVRAEIAALEAQVSFFAGSYTEALRHAGSTMELADRAGDPRLRIFARRAACLVHGNLDAPGWVDELRGLIDLSAEAGDRWQEAISRNDLAHWLMSTGEHAEAERELARGIELAATLAPGNRLCVGVLHCTRAELRLAQGRPEEALADAQLALGRLTSFDEPHPYLWGMTTKLEVQALLALGRPDEASRSGERAVERLGEGVPQARSMILESVATALREAGRHEDAFEALARGAQLERRALQELIELQAGFDRATLEAKAARELADELAEKNRELEALQAQLREQADRDPLTGLHNRRYLMRVLDELAAEPPASPTSLAVIDLDHFKRVNDAHGHAAGDQVLVRTSALLRAAVRTADVLARSGGEEFVLVMPQTGAQAARAVCERVVEALRRESWQRIAPDITVTASVGVTTIPASAPAPVDVAAALAQADALLYAAKAAGRDRVASELR